MEGREYRSIRRFIDGDHIESGCLIVMEFGSAAVVWDVGAEIMWMLIFGHGGIRF